MENIQEKEADDKGKEMEIDESLIGDNTDGKEADTESKHESENITEECRTMDENASTKDADVSSCTPENDVSVASSEVQMISKESEVNEETSNTKTSNEDNGEPDACSQLLRVDAKPGEPGFSTEFFKIEIKNLPRNVSHGQLKKLLVQLKLKPKKIKVMSHSRYCFVTFSCEEDKQKAMKTLENYNFRNYRLVIKNAKALADPCKPTGRDNAPPKDPKEELLTPAERIQNAVTPLWAKPYEVQITTKFRSTVDLLKKMSNDLLQIHHMDPWVKKNSEENNGKCCFLHDIIKSPVLKGYRNKNEFTVGQGPNGEEKTVGFRLSAYRKGDCTVVEPDDCVNVSQEMKDVVKSFQAYIRTSEFPAINPVTHKGNWQQIMIRTCHSGDIMAVVQFFPQSLAQDVIDQEKKKLADFYQNGGGSHLKIKSLYFQTNNVLNAGGNSNAPMECISGDEYIYEEIFGLKFRISPSSFFQVNTKAAELLFSKIKEWCNITPETTFLDICCGTGTIGLTIAKDCRRMIGIEMIKQAIDDAKFNAQLNGITNGEYICGKAEDILPNLVDELKHLQVVGVVDPPRAGLHPIVVKAIRACTSLTTLIYVSCNPHSAYNNFIDLCRPVSKRTRGAPFRLVQAIPVDLFPHTKHCELVLQFVRDEDITDYETSESYKEAYYNTTNYYKRPKVSNIGQANTTEVERGVNKVINPKMEKDEEGKDPIKEVDSKMGQPHMEKDEEGKDPIKEVDSKMGQSHMETDQEEKEPIKEADSKMGLADHSEEEEKGATDVQNEEKKCESAAKDINMEQAEMKT